MALNRSAAADRRSRGPLARHNSVNTRVDELQIPRSNAILQKLAAGRSCYVNEAALRAYFRPPRLLLLVGGYLTHAQVPTSAFVRWQLSDELMHVGNKNAKKKNDASV